MPEENINQEFRLKKIDEIRNYLIEEINQNKLISKNHKKVCRVLNDIDHSVIVTSTITGCISISAFASLKICVLNAGIKKYKPIIKKKRKMHDEIVLLAKSKLNSIVVLVSKALIDSNISHDEFVLIDNVLKEFYDTKEEIKNSNNRKQFKLYIKQCCLIV